MKAIFETLNPEVLEMKLTISMPISEWRELRATLKDITRWPIGDFKDTLDDLISQAERHFYPKEEVVK